MRGSLSTICILMVALWGCGTESSEPGVSSNAQKTSGNNDAQSASAPLPEIRYYVLSKS